MNPLRALIVDDERLSRLALRQLLRMSTDVVIVGECSGVSEAEAYLADTDVAFLDVQMPLRSGLEAASSWNRGAHAPFIVFVTAFDEFAVAAFETDAVDYLTKPVSAPRLEQALTRVRHRKRAAQALTAESGTSGGHSRLVTRVGDTEMVIVSDSIDCIEADGLYAAVWVGRRRLLVRQSLDSLEEQLCAAEFLRVHQSWIVATNRVVAIRHSARGGRALALTTGRLVPASRRRQAHVARSFSSPRSAVQNERILHP
ncbi:MAG: LytTR family DNA-binding domain-containing protein [bacterium]